jgi:hypothetical protein
MDIIPYARFILSLVIGGFLIYIFNNVNGMVGEYFPNGSQFGVAISMLWHGTIFIILIIEAIRLFMTIQRRQVM